MTVNKELQLELHTCCDCSTIEGESELSMNREQVIPLHNIFYLYTQIEVSTLLVGATGIISKLSLEYHKGVYCDKISHTDGGGTVGSAVGLATAREWWHKHLYGDWLVWCVWHLDLLSMGILPVLGLLVLWDACCPFLHCLNSMTVP